MESHTPIYIRGVSRTCGLVTKLFSQTMVPGNAWVVTCAKQIVRFSHNQLTKEPFTRVHCRLSRHLYRDRLRRGWPSSPPGVVRVVPAGRRRFAGERPCHYMGRVAGSCSCQRRKAVIAANGDKIARRCLSATQAPRRPWWERRKKRKTATQCFPRTTFKHSWYTIILTTQVHMPLENAYKLLC